MTVLPATRDHVRCDVTANGCDTHNRNVCHRPFIRTTGDASSPYALICEGVRYSTVSAVRYSTIHYHAVQYITVRYSIVQ